MYKFMRKLNQGRAGQSLSELAIFSAVLLFAFTLLLRYGMSNVQQQNMQMQTFRKAFVRAASTDSGRSGRFDPGWTYENGNPPLPSNHWRRVSYTVLEDKQIFDARGVLPILDRRPVGGSANAVCSIDMFGRMAFPGNVNNPADPAHLDIPRAEYEINGRRYSFTTAAFRTVNVSGQTLRTREANLGAGASWYWSTVTLDDLVVGDMVDVDGDGHEEQIMGIETRMVPQGGGFLGRLYQQVQVPTGVLHILDYQEGEIDFAQEDAQGNRVQGLQPDYDQTLSSGGSSLARSETRGGINTTDNINVNHAINRVIVLNGGAGGTRNYPIQDVVSAQRTTTMSATH
jgi:hypothetical protein